MRLALLLPLLAISGTTSAETLAWKIPDRSVLEYSVYEGRSKKPSGPGLFFFASEFTEKGKNRIAIHRYEDLPWHFLFQLPEGEAKRGTRWVQTAQFFHESSFAAGLWSWRGATTIRPLQGTGRYTIKKLKKGIATIEGSFLFYEIRRDTANNRVRLTVTKNKIGSLATAVEFDVERGVVVRGGYNLSIMRGQAREFEKGEWKIRDRKIRVTRRIELSEVVELDPGNMAKAIEAGKKRAIAWLKKKQESGGGFGTDRVLETSRVDANVTGLVVEALIAAGVEADDPAIKKALQSIQAEPGPATPQSYRNAIVALMRPWMKAGETIAELRKSLPGTIPDETKRAIRAASKLLLDLQDSDSGAWAPGQTRRTSSPNSVTNYHAVEGLFYAWLAGEEFPDRLAGTLLEWYSDKEIQEDMGVELNLEGSVDWEDEKVTPVTWPYSFRSSSNRNPLGGGTSKGTAISVLAALETIALLRTQADLAETEKKGVDRMIRRGLGWVQRFWTLRTPPPAEASWSFRRMEHLLLVMRVMTAYGIETIDRSDWHLEGAYLLLRGQFQDGSWDRSGGRAVQDTAAGLLFLSRGALPILSP